MHRLILMLALLAPNAALALGAIDSAITQANIAATICRPGYTRTVRPPARWTTALKRSQLAARHYADRNPRDFEEDHRVPLEAGGAPRDPRNLWPQPWRGPWNAHMKDRLEDYVHKETELYG